jgi:hypothetical protein
MVPGVKRPEREADHSFPSSAMVENAWIYTSTPSNVFMVWCLVKHRDNFTVMMLLSYFAASREMNAGGEAVLRCPWNKG